MVDMNKAHLELLCSQQGSSVHAQQFGILVMSEMIPIMLVNLCSHNTSVLAGHGQVDHS